MIDKILAEDNTTEKRPNKSRIGQRQRKGGEAFEIDVSDMKSQSIDNKDKQPVEKAKEPELAKAASAAAAPGQ